ncbi:MAG: glucosaminidase domain-containing protein [Actinobacteria bacterium]|nr:glucosaminidase domain-containing protein [Actinomycetota bacterium]
MRQPSPRWIAGIAGAALVLAGAALAAVVAGAPDRAPSATAQSTLAGAVAPTTTGSIIGAPGSGDTGADAAPSEFAPVPHSDAAEQEPFWKIKQREAEAQLLREGDETGAVGIVAAISFDPAREAAFAAAATPPSTTTPATAGSPPASSTPSTAGGSTTRTVGQNGATPLAGVWTGTAGELSRYLLRYESAPKFTVPAETLAGYYVRYGAEVGLRADVLWAQMIHETGFGAYGGDVSPAQNNYAGIGATGGGAPGISFPTAEAGVKAHVAHMVAYVFTEDRATWVNSTTDPRYHLVSPRGVARVLSDLNGRWAVPGDGYGAAIERHVRAINGS